MRLTEAQQQVIIVLGDGEWHRGSRSGGAGTVLGTPAVALVRMGLVERRGESKTAKPSNSGYEYRLIGHHWPDTVPRCAFCTGGVYVVTTIDPPAEGPCPYCDGTGYDY